MRIRKETLGIAVLAFLCFLLAAFRPLDVGTDTPMYGAMFKANDFSSVDDVGFILLNKCIRSVTRNPRYLFVVCSLVITVCFAKGIIAHSKWAMLSFVLFVFLFYFASLNIMRQFMAVSVFYGLAITEIRKHNLGRFTLYCVISVSIHFSAVLLIVTYFVQHLKLSRPAYLMIWCLSLIPFWVPLMDPLQNVFGMMSFMEFNSDLSFYLQNIGNLFDEEKTNVYLFVLNCIVVLFVLHVKKIRMLNDSVLFVNLFVLNVVLMNCFNRINVMARMDYMFGISIVFVLADVALLYRKWVAVVMVCCSILLFYYNYVVRGVGEVFV